MPRIAALGFALVLGACHGSPVAEGATSDGGGTATDARALPDGRPCIGPDEDGDGWPDECDDCPNVANPAQDGTKLVGNECLPQPSFAAAYRRLFFEAFSTAQTYGTLGGGYEVRDGALSMGALDDDHLRLVEVSGVGKSPGSRWVVATAVMSIQNGAGVAGLVARLSAGTKRRFYACGVQLAEGGKFFPAQAPAPGCNGGSCILLLWTRGGDAATPVISLVPPTIERGVGKPIGVRISIRNETGYPQGLIECRVFDPRNPTNLAVRDETFASEVVSGYSDWLASGEVGFFAQNGVAWFSSLDVIVGE